MPSAKRDPGRTLLTDRTLGALKPAQSGQRETLWDTSVRGLAVRVGARGRPAFYVVRRRAGDSRPSWRKLGDYPAMKLAEAREAARQALGALSEGKDPAAVATAKQRKQQRQRADLFEAVAEEFATRLEAGRIRKVRGGGGPLRNAAELAAIVRRELIPALHGRPINEITRRDIRESIEAIVARGEDVSPTRRKGGPYAARHALAAARRLFSWALSRDLIEQSPCDGLKPVELHGAPAQRDRVLTDEELRLVWHAAEAAGYPFGPLVKLLLLTGQRRDEIADMRWPEVDNDVLTIPAERMKGGFAQTVPLSPTAIEVLGALPRFAGGDYVFSTMAGQRPVSGFSKMKSRLDGAMVKLASEGAAQPETVTIEPFTLHDLRRTVRTGLSSVGVLPVIAELTIGHKQTGISAIYDRHRYDLEKRDALERWERKLLATVNTAPPTAPGVVVQMRSRARPRARA